MAILPPIPPHEDERLDALRRLNLLDSEADPAYQALAELAASLIGTPIAAISLIDADRQWTKAGVGLVHGDQDPRDISFCAHTIASDSDPWVIDDATADPDFADNPLVTGGRVGFYAGAPVRTADGHAIECAADASQAMARLADQPFGFDLVITDHCMAGTSGLELVEWLRALAYTGKILVLTAEANPAISDAYRRLRVDGIVYKPTWPSELRQIVNDLMG